jgi:hypothetical protein
MFECYTPKFSRENGLSNGTKIVGMYQQKLKKHERLLGQPSKYSMQFIDF